MYVWLYVRARALLTWEREGTSTSAAATGPTGSLSTFNFFFLAALDLLWAHNRAVSEGGWLAGCWLCKKVANSDALHFARSLDGYQLNRTVRIYVHEILFYGPQKTGPASPCGGNFTTGGDALTWLGLAFQVQREREEAKKRSIYGCEGVKCYDHKVFLCCVKLNFVTYLTKLLHA